MYNSRGCPMAHDAARVSLMLHQTHENWEASRDFPRFSDGTVGELHLLSLCSRAGNGNSREVRNEARRSDSGESKEIPQQ